MDSCRQFIRFAMVGALGFGVDVGILYLTLHIGFGYFFGRVISFLCAVWVTWMVNRRFTFSTRPNSGVLNEAIRYLAAMSLGGLINYAAYSLVIVQGQNIPFLPFFAVAVGSLAGMVINYFSARLWVFKLSEKCKK
ncbi:GtrA family protein [Glaciimonas sp. CA11.2]|uniref:GtrA family protein n=2 Tax=Glaciimonas TaxID=1229970 RepID=UPI002AB34A9B|nr:GtrA family protein [Glaciimonas sp. CA11.2]MDY7548581.1 GtrA family protein [Glaciimonas sp. CA11.2]